MNVLSYVKKLQRLSILNLLLQTLTYFLIYSLLIAMNLIHLMQSVFHKILNKIWVQQILVTLVLGSVCSVLFYFMLGASETELHGRYLSHEKFYQRVEQIEVEIVVPSTDMNKSHNVQMCNSSDNQNCRRSN